MQSQEIGARRVPAVFDDLKNDLAVELSLELRRRGITAPRFFREKLGLGRRRSFELEAYLKGSTNSDAYGLMPALRLAEDLGIPMRILVGDEAR